MQFRLDDHHQLYVRNVYKYLVIFLAHSHTSALHARTLTRTLTLTYTNVTHTYTHSHSLGPTHK